MKIPAVAGNLEPARIAQLQKNLVVWSLDRITRFFSYNDPRVMISCNIMGFFRDCSLEPGSKHLFLFSEASGGRERKRASWSALECCFVQLQEEVTVLVLFLSSFTPFFVFLLIMFTCFVAMV